MEHLSQTLGGVIGTLPLVYLGMPSWAKSGSIDIWNPILEKCEKKLAKWRSQYLSLGGRLTLINFVLDALPTYMLSIFHIPQSIVQMLDKTRRNFLWQGNKERKAFHLVKWKNIIRSKVQGGLGIKNLKNHSKALKVKWLWRNHQEGQALWYRVINKYEELNKWVTKEGHNKGSYKVKEGYKQISLGGIQDLKWPWKQIWRIKVPHKVACFTWLLVNEAILTQDNVAKRGISLCNRCSLCGKANETVRHVFLHCNFTDQLWQIFLNLRGISWSMPSKINETLFSWEMAGVGATNKERWRMIPACIWWTIWMGEKR
ncbi:hypothetical protein MTR67_031028 [Solanum verrucosum]|uniref:Reverse transcriptase zinc-binding domain-containing protein n=1 Tax=Solanum verrucosum TaxID=315347 RepID=A0AAF0U1P9_SOLVR|nr:hypothetical protein MTR67_031028 [Solanum verrucosum]